MKMRKCTLVMLLVLFFNLIASSSEKNNYILEKGITMQDYFSPLLTSKFALLSNENINAGIGAGIGVPYGVFGGRAFVQYSNFEGSLGLGLFLLSWNPVFSASGSIHFLSPESLFKPKLTLSVTNDAAEIIFFDQSFTTLYNEKFPGLAFYAGSAIKFKEDGHLGLDFNIGYIFISGGNDKFIDQYESVKTDLKNQGYSFSDDDIVTIKGLKFSMGLLYFF